jgi:hypothetical protein
MVPLVHRNDLAYSVILTRLEEVDGREDIGSYRANAPSRVLVYRRSSTKM